MPDWAELGARLGQQLPPEYAADSPLEVVSAYQYAFGRGRLIDAMQHELHVADANPGPAHAEFCSIPFEVVVTTNVEQLLEQEYRAKYGSILQVVEQEQLRIRNIYPSPMLVKLHGDLEHPSSLVLTESDYDSFLDRRSLFATWLANQLITKTGVLIGYSLADPDFRAVLEWLRARLGSIPPDLYVFEVDADPVKVQRYMRRGVRVVNLQSKRRGWAILETLFKALAEHWEAQAPSHVTANTTIGRVVLRANTRLGNVILFIVNRSRLSDYNENVFPTLIERGLVPITEEDVLSPPGNELAGLDILLRAANQVVVEVEQPNDPQLERAVRAVGPDRTLIVTRSARAWDEQDYQTPLRAPNTIAEWESFVTELINRMQHQRQQLSNVQVGTTYEVQSLLEKGQYQMAFLTGVVELEGRLNRLFGAYELMPRTTRGKQASLRDLLNAARIEERLDVSPQEISDLTEGRNLVVHGRDVSSRTLHRLAGLVLRLLEQLPEQ